MMRWLIGVVLGFLVWPGLCRLGRLIWLYTILEGSKGHKPVLAALDIYGRAVLKAGAPAQMGVE